MIALDPVAARLGDPSPLGPEEVERLLDRLGDPKEPESARLDLLGRLADRPLQEADLERFARALRARAVPFGAPAAREAIDLCGSGGASRPSFNISTVSAFVVAAAGLRVVKHGNRSARGPCGSSDLLEALGLPVTTSRAFARDSFERFGLAFLHAPLYHPTTSAVAQARRRLGRPTIFNRLGPLVNPAGPRLQLTGVADRASAGAVASILRGLGVERGAVVAALDGADELSPTAGTELWAWSESGSTHRTVDPEALLDPPDRRGPWDPLPRAEAARATVELLAGERGARRGAVLLTAGCALWVAGASRDLPSGVARATEVLDGGLPARLLDRLQEHARQPGWREGAP
jgi:anthranilate phosphoribosyltransferase